MATGKRKKKKVKERKKIFFPSIYMKLNWTFNYLKVMKRINESSEKTNRKKKKKKRKRKTRKKENKNNFLHLYIWKWTDHFFT